MHSISQELEQLLNCLDPETALLLEQTVRDAVALATKRATALGDLDAMGYPVGYFDATSGSFATEPLDAPSELPFETRESW